MWNELEISFLCTLIFRIITTNNYLQAAVTRKLYFQEQYRVKLVDISIKISHETPAK